MSRRHPVVAVTGSSGAGTTTVKLAFEHMFFRKSIKAAVIEGDSLHSLTRSQFNDALAAAETTGEHFSHFGPEANHFDKVEELFKGYGETGRGRRRYYLHSAEEAARHSERLGCEVAAGEFTPWEDLPEATDLLFYEGLHGLVAHGSIATAPYVDLGIGVVPVVNLEWIQKIHRDGVDRGHSADVIVDTIMRRMPDYVKYITPQFSQTHINFQRVPTVDTSNPFIARDIPTLDESLIIVRFRNPKGVDFPYLITMIPDSFMSRANTLVVPGGKMGYAMELILEPIIERLVAASKGGDFVDH
jgi:phosphoribulokinase